MADPIKIEFEVDGATEAANAVEGVGQSLGEVAEKAPQATAATTALAAQQAAASAKAIEFASKLAAAASAIQGVTSALGLEGRAAGLVGSITQTSVAMAQLGQTFGPQGALVGGIVGAVIPALAAVRSAMEETEQRNAEWAERLEELGEQQEEAREAIEETSRAIDEQAQSIESVTDRMREFIDSLSVNGLEDQAFTTAAQITSLTDRLSEVNDELANLEGDTGTAAAARILDLRIEAGNLTQTINGLAASFGNIQSQIDAGRSRRGGGSSGPSEQDRLQQQWRDELEYAAAELERLNAELEDDMITALGGVADAENVIAGILDEQNALKREAIELSEQQAAADLKAAEANQAIKEKQRELEDARIAQAEGAYNELFSVGQSVTGLLTDAMKEVASGSATAEEAMLGLLKGFLEYISQWATLKALGEFAEAASAFARYDYAGGALHVGAGVLFTGVAVATGVGAAAIAPSAPAEPAKPSQESSGSSKAGGDIVINYNSPVITGATYADLGQQQRNMIRAAESRYGSA